MSGFYKFINHTIYKLNGDAKRIQDQSVKEEEIERHRER